MNRLRNVLIMFLHLAMTAPLLAAGHPQLGVQTHYGHKGWEPLSTLDAIKEMGVGWIRDDLFWSSVEKEKGQYEIPDYAWEWIKAAQARDLKIIVILNGSNGKYEDKFDPQAYANFARFVAKELKGHVHALELINEPFNHFRRGQPNYGKEPSHWNAWDPQTGQTDPWLFKYQQAMNSMADAIHEVAPNQFKILALGCSPPVNARLLKMGISPNVDGMVLHPYSHRSIPELQAYGNTAGYLKRDGITVGDERGTFVSINQELMALAAKHNGPKELWLTEQGYTTRWKHSGSRFAGYTESAQAKYAQRRLMECLGSGVRFAAWYNFYEKGNRPNNSEDHFGIMRRDGSLKPAYHAIQTVAKTMLGWKDENWGDVKVFLMEDRPDTWPIVWDGSRMASTGASRAYTFAKDKQRAVAIWSTERADGDLQPRSADVQIISDRVTRTITALDMMTGQITDVAFEQNGQTITIKQMSILDHPVLLILDGAQPAVTEQKPSSNVFASDQAWKISKSSGVNATWTLGQSDNHNQATLEFTWPQKGGFCGASTQLTLNEGTDIISFEHNASVPTTLLLRVYDSSKQTHQFKFRASGSGQWQAYKINIARNRKQSWGGANDKTIHYPITGILLGAEQAGDASNGTVQFRDLQMAKP